MNKLFLSLIVLIFVFPALVFAGLSRAFTDSGSALLKVWRSV